MGRNDGFLFLSICNLAIVLISHVTGDYLVLFRGKSKHTSLISPFNKWTLPEEELKSCYGRSFFDRYFFHSESLPIGKGDTFRRLVALTTNFSNLDLHGAKAETTLKFACQKCILLHGLFEIWGEGNSIHEAVASAKTSEHYQIFSRLCVQQRESVSDHQLLSLRIAASVLEQPWLPSKTLDDNILSKFDILWRNFSLRPPGEKGTALDFDMRVYVDETSGYCVLCRHLARGLAAPSKSGEGGRDPLPLTGSLRRPLSGLLNTFALKSLPYRSPTAMEPEIAFLMANLAEVKPGSRILDPFAGCCSLLLAAGYLQEMEPPNEVSEQPYLMQEMEKSNGLLVGVDASMGADTEPIRSNFAAMGLTSRLASLSLRWDIAERLIKGTERFYGDAANDFHNHTHGGGILSTLPEGFAFDAIITDPPYDMVEAVQHRRSEKAPSRDERSKHHNTDPLSAAHILTDDEDAETLEDSRVSPSISTHFPTSSSSSSAAVDGNILTLLRLASETLRVGGKLVFFAPHRAIDVLKSSDDQSSGGHGRGKRENAESGEVPASYLIDASHGLSPSIKDDGDCTSSSSGMGVKMSKRKAFKRRARITKDKNEDDSQLPRAAHIGRGTSRLGPTSPLDFLPPIPDSLTLVGYHEQVMSPSFSRWLCVMQKI